MNRIFIFSKICKFSKQFRMYTTIDKSKIDLPINYNDEKVHNFKQLSYLFNILMDEFRMLHWVSNANNIERILKFNKNNPKLMDLLTKINNFNEFNESIKYFTLNLDKLNVKEQGILFKILNTLSKDKSDHKIFLQIEQNYYKNIDKMDLNDFLNYYSGIIEFIIKINHTMALFLYKISRHYLVFTRLAKSNKRSILRIKILLITPFRNFYLFIKPYFFDSIKSI